MAYVEGSIDVNRDITAVYDQWARFESFPGFMDGVDSVTQLDEVHLHWVADIAGRTREWDAEIVQQIPDTRISWSGIGVAGGGTVTLAPIGSDQTRVTLRLEYQPEDWSERAGDALALAQRRVRQDLDDFKRFIESGGQATGGRRDRVAS